MSEPAVYKNITVEAGGRPNYQAGIMLYYNSEELCVLLTSLPRRYCRNFLAHALRSPPLTALSGFLAAVHLDWLTVDGLTTSKGVTAVLEAGAALKATSGWHIGFTVNKGEKTLEALLEILNAMKDGKLPGKNVRMMTQSQYEQAVRDNTLLIWSNPPVPLPPDSVRVSALVLGVLVAALLKLLFLPVFPLRLAPSVHKC